MNTLVRAEPRGDCAGTGPSKQEARAAAAKKLWETDRQVLYLDQS